MPAPHAPPASFELKLRAHVFIANFTGIRFVLLDPLSNDLLAPAIPPAPAAAEIVILYR